MIGILAATSAIVFAPPTDRALVVRVAEERTDDRGTIRLTSQRSIRFERAGDGYVATVILHATTGEAPAGAARMFERAIAALFGVPLRFMLDARGTMIGSAIAPDVWARFVAGMATATDRPGSGAAPIIARLRTAPQPEQTRMLASLLTTILPIAGGTLAPHAPRAVTSSARLPSGAALAMSGEDRADALPDGRLRLTRALAGSADGVTMRNREDRHIDSRTGLCVERRETTVIETDGKSLTTVRTTVIAPSVS